MKRRIRELAAWIMTFCIVCGGIWMGGCTVYAADTFTLTWTDILYDIGIGDYKIETHYEYQLEEGTLIDLPQDPTKPGYVFLGWDGYESFETSWGNELYKQSDADIFKNLNITMISENAFIYANWIPIYYIISYDGNGAESGTPDIVHGALPDDEVSAPVFYGNEVKLSDQVPARTGYVFNGWEYEGTLYEAGGTFTVPDVTPEEVEGPIITARSTQIIYVGYITLKASWSPNMHRVTYDGNGASSGTPAAQEAGYETSVTVGAAPVREGYAFTGWLSSDGNVYQPGSTFSMPDQDVGLTAQWEVANTGGISAAGSYYLLKGQSYRLNGVTGTEGEAGSYMDGITFYVPSDGYYTFTE